MEDDKIFCAFCGEEITDDDYETIDGDYVCLSCVEDNYEKCDYCGEYHEAGTLTTVGDGDRVCDDCLSENYTYCEDCSEYYKNEDMTYVERYDIYVCQDCLDNNYTECRSCGEIISTDDAQWSDLEDEYYCEDCYCDRFSRCDDCGCEMYNDDSYYCEADGNTYCGDCINDHERGGSGTIYSYHASCVHYEPRYHDDIDRNMNEKELYGLELEIAGDEDYAEDFQDYLGNDAVLMYDSSVDGFEMVSMPMTRQYFFKDFVPKLEKGLRYLSNNDCRGHNAGGIHVHFRRLENGMQVANMASIMYGSDMDKKIWLKITQRRPENMHWCSMSTSILPLNDIVEHDYMSPSGSSDFHGTALNFDTRTNTHELRIFNSNLRLERVLKNLECVFALQDYVRRASELICDTRGFLNFVDEHAVDYPHLADFMHEKKIFDIANRFYGDTYTSEPNNVNLANVQIEDGEDTRTDEIVDNEIEELLQAVG